MPLAHITHCPGHGCCLCCCSYSDLYAVLDDRRAGDRIKVEIIRDTKTTSLTVVLGERALGLGED